ncbi:PREDICTED: uncharacterized protein LOC108758252 [Trachymyrmex cornetzi]|uniref:Uncharacterized protein n=1 Tax=Trachymyrmex cornetzi TaxID=471704 RepID=A0A151JCI1_9HYME|nr:PREDICTED: uncharacterized protein LOC108758252 [Trachymyrmex cornetzi]KYN23499.1 hypothetical protein ALC57_04083 [Trachymyrmex cornetzi]
MFWCYSFLIFLFLLGDTYGGMSKSRVRRQDSSAQSGHLIDNIFNIPITAIRQTASAVQIISPGNTQRIDSIVKIPVSTLQAVGTLVKTTREQGQQIPDNIQARQERRERILALKEQKRKRKEEIQNQRLLQQQLKRTVRHHQKDPLGLDALSNLLIGHHAGGLLGHHSRLGGIHRLHRGHKIGHGLHKPGIHHGIHDAHLGNHPQHTYEVHEDINEDTSFSWHGLIAGFGTFTGIRPSSTSIKIENKVAPKENIKNKLTQEYYDPLENKIAPRNGRVAFVQ